MGSCCQIPEAPLDAQAAPSSRATSFSSASLWTGWFSFGLLALMAGLVMTLTLAVNIDPPKGHTRTIIHSALALLSGLGILIYGWRIFRNALQAKITLETLFLIGLMGSYGASLFSSITGVGFIYYEVVLVLLAIYRLGQLISGAQLQRCENLASEIPGLKAKVLLITNEGEKSIPVAKLKIGDRILVSAGETIPADGIIQKGETYVEELAHTGEPFPAVRAAGDPVRAGMIALDGQIEIEAKTSGTEREIDRLHTVLAKKGESRIEKSAKHILDFFVPFVVVVATATAIYWGFWRQDWQAALFNALAVTLVACPCGLGLAIPLAARRGRFHLILQGIRVQNQDLLDGLASVDTVVFDKTGTLTEPRLTLADLQTEHHAPPELKAWLASIQQKSTHPVARPFWTLATAAPLKELHLATIPARGIEARFEAGGKSQTIHIVNQLFLDIDLQKKKPCCCMPLNDTNKRTLYILLNGQQVGVATLGESSREGSDFALQRIHDLGCRVGILTGDSSIPNFLKNKVDFAESGYTTSEKGASIQSMEESGKRVLYVGDGLNDSEAAYNAHVSIVLSSGNSVAGDNASAILEHNDLSVIPDILTTAKHARVRLRALLVFVLAYNSIGMILAATGVLHPVAAAILMFLSSITVLGMERRILPINETK